MSLVTVVLLVNALRSATRLIMSSGAMTCPIRCYIRNLFNGRGRGKVQT